MIATLWLGWIWVLTKKKAHAISYNMWKYHTIAGDSILIESVAISACAYKWPLSVVT